MSAIENNAPQVDRQLDSYVAPATAPASQEVTGTAAGVAGRGPGEIPPASSAASPNVTPLSTTISLAPGSGMPAEARVDAAAAAANRFALGSMESARALFKAMLDSAQHDLDDAYEKYKRFMEEVRSKQLAQAGASRQAAHDMMAGAKTAAVCGAASAACTVGGAYADGNKSKTFLDASTKGFDGAGKYADTQGASQSKIVEAGGSIAGADAERAKTNQADLDKAMQQHRDRFAQMAQAMKELGDSHAAQLAAASGARV